MNRNFIGKWTLLSERSEYENGIPPKEASYEFIEGKDESLNVVIKWKDINEKEFEVEYNTMPDGQRKVYENPQIADEVMSEFESENVLNSYTYKDGKTIAFASRIINKDGIMKVLQRFFTLDGSHFDNIQYYEK